MAKTTKLQASPRLLQLKLNIFNQQKDLSFSRRSVRAVVEAVLKSERAAHTEVSVYFVSEKKISSLHKTFFDDPSPTDCISFPLDNEELGEVFVCPQTAIEYADKHQLDPYDETALYLIHGLLHCLGYDDLEPNQRRTMRKKEKSCMALIKKLGISLRKR